MKNDLSRSAKVLPFSKCSRSLRRKRIISQGIKASVFLWMLFACFLAACNPGTTQIPSGSISSAVSGARDSLSFRITWLDYSGRGEAIRKIVDLYNTKNPDGAAVFLLGGDEDLAAVETLLQNSDDTVFVLPYRYVKYFGEKGYLQDLTADFAQEKEVVNPALWDLGRADGISYGIPWLTHSVCLIYNKSLLEKAGVDPDSIDSLNALTEALSRVEEKTDAKGIGLVGADHNDVSWMVNQFIYGFGSTLVNQYGTKVAVNNDMAKAAIEFYKNVLGSYAQPSWTGDTGVEVMDCFRRQEVAFEFQGIWGVTDIEKNGSPFEVGIIRLEDIGLCPEVGPLMLAVPKTLESLMRGDALRWIRFLLSEEAQTKIMDGEYSPEHDAYYPFRMPVRKDLLDRLIRVKYPQYLSFVEGFDRPSIDVPVPKWQRVKDLYYAPGLHQVMTGAVSIEDFLRTIETEGNKILVQD